MSLLECVYDWVEDVVVHVVKRMANGVHIDRVICAVRLFRIGTRAAKAKITSGQDGRPKYQAGHIQIHKWPIKFIQM